MNYDAEILAQCVTLTLTVTNTFFSMPATTEEELKNVYFTAFGARLVIVLFVLMFESNYGQIQCEVLLIETRVTFKNDKMTPKKLERGSL